MTKPTFFVEEDKIITALFEAGLECLHICKPNSEPVFCERLVSLINPAYYKYITVHEHHYLKNEFELGKVHINLPSMAMAEGMSDKEQVAFYKDKLSFVKKDLGKMSATVKTRPQFIAAEKYCQYAFHINAFNGEGLSTLAQKDGDPTKKDVNRHVYALGNINEETIKRAKDLGYGGVVVSEELWNCFDIRSQVDYKAMLQKFERLRRIVD